MSSTDRTEDPEPCEPVPAGPLHVPVRPGPAGCTARFFRTPPGERTAVGFTSVERLTATLGADQPWIRLSEPALRALARPLGIGLLTVDPQLCAPATTPEPAPAGAEPLPARRDRDPRRAGVLRVAGAAAVVSCPHLLIG
ncbi:SAV_915 family protein [Streptomyces sp. NPDC059564]|uniref:SAV_915 family protein n=1 Tax=Streptomyces sp. NPDC059564 TaxID=3346865 RepID=UPI003693EA28